MTQSCSKIPGELSDASGNQTAGWDRFDRVEQVRFATGTVGSSSSSSSSSTTVEILEQVQYGFDPSGNRRWHAELAAPLYAQQDEFYNYDGLRQLSELSRGNLNVNQTAIAGVPAWQEQWNFDATGNWHSDDSSSFGYEQTTYGAVTLDQNRTHDQANDIVTITGGGWASPENDATGNATVIPSPLDPTGPALDCVYDAWSRLVSVSSGGTVIATYEYDGMGRRVRKVLHPASSPVTHDYVYSDQWQVLNDISEGAGYNFIWGIRYPDDLIARTAPNGLFEPAYFAIHDYLNVTAVADDTGTVNERFGYDAYGNPIAMDPSFTVTASPAYPDWEFQFNSAYRDAETGLYLMRYRFMHPGLGRWLTRDPRGYLFGRSSLLLYVNNAPIDFADPLGLSLKDWTGLKTFKKIGIACQLAVHALFYLTTKCCHSLPTGACKICCGLSTAVIGPTLNLIFAAEQATCLEFAGDPLWYVGCEVAAHLDFINSLKELDRLEKECEAGC